MADVIGAAGSAETMRTGQSKFLIQAGHWSCGHCRLCEEVTEANGRVSPFQPADCCRP